MVGERAKKKFSYEGSRLLLPSFKYSRKERKKKEGKGKGDEEDPRRPCYFLPLSGILDNSSERMGESKEGRVSLAFNLHNKNFIGRKEREGIRGEGGGKDDGEWTVKSE